MPDIGDAIEVITDFTGVGGELFVGCLCGRGGRSDGVGEVWGGGFLNYKIGVVGT